MNAQSKKNNPILIVIIGMVVVMLTLVVGTVWMGQRAKRTSDD